MAKRQRSPKKQEKDIEPAVSFGDGLRPRLDGGPLDLDGRPAPPAHQVVVVVGARAPAVDGLARVGAQHVDLAAVGQRLQRAVHGGEADAVACAAQLLVDLLGGAEVVEAVQQCGDGGALAGGAHGARHGVGSVRASSAWVETESKPMYAKKMIALPASIPTGVPPADSVPNVKPKRFNPPHP